MSALDREINLAMMALDEQYKGKFTYSMTRIFLTGWLLSKGYPVDGLDIVQIFDNYEGKANE
jgi:hypothetical protein